MHIEYFPRNEVLSSIKKSQKAIYSLTKAENSFEYIQNLELILDHFHQTIIQVLNTRKYIPLDKRTEYNLLLQYSKNLLSSISICFKNSDYIAINSLIEEEVPSCITSWEEFLQQVKW